MDTDSSNANRNFMWAGWIVAVLALVCLILSISVQFRSSEEQKPLSASPSSVAPMVTAQSPQQRPWAGFPRVSPFKGIRWRNETPEVLVDGQWYELVAINDIPVEQIIAFAKTLGADTWQKHFSEDLVEVMTRMGHQPESTVTLSVKELPSGNAKVLKDVPMTEENRTAILNANSGTGPHD